MGEKKTKSHLVEIVAAKTGSTKADATKALDSVLDGITDLLKGGDELTIPGFGKFSVKHVAARKGRNVSTGAEIDIAAKNAPKFAPGKTLKDAVNA
jgi:DNA-binding protein HU-beta